MMLLSEHTGTHLDAPSHFHLTHKRLHDAIEAGDLIAIDNPDEWWEPTHFTFVVLPLPVRGGTASLARPIALVHQ
jgi:kynurenine formamidase